MIGARTRAVARWELLRFAKLKDLVIGALIFAALFGAGTLFGEFAGRKMGAEQEIAVLEPERLGLTEPVTLVDVQLEPFEFTPDAAGLARVDSLLVVEEIDGALVPTEDGWQLRVRRERTWTGRVQAQLVGLVQQVRLSELQLDPEVLAEIVTPPSVRTTVVDPPREGVGKASPLSAILVVALMMLGLFVGFSYVFVAITGEKTQRVTESLLSVLTPQEWIDGKILGLTAVVLLNLASTVGGYLLWKVIDWIAFGGSLGAPAGIDPGVLLVSAAFATLGFLFWFTCFAMIAATIDDPNTSQRSSFMFLPMLPISLVFGGLDAADATWMRALSLVPGVSPVAMPVRLLRGEPAVWEIVLALVLLALGAWWFRRAAGRMFGTSMLMTGKEPSLREVWRWLREST